MALTDLFLSEDPHCISFCWNLNNIVLCKFIYIAGVKNRAKDSSVDLFKVMMIPKWKKKTKKQKGQNNDKAEDFLVFEGSIFMGPFQYNDWICTEMVSLALFVFFTVFDC